VLGGGGEGGREGGPSRSCIYAGFFFGISYFYIITVLTFVTIIVVDTFYVLFTCGMVTLEEQRGRKAEERAWKGRNKREKEQRRSERESSKRRNKRRRATAGLTRVPSLVDPCLV